ncbi:hypothetical protein DOA99_23055 [Salmonella enterica subsp. houtenae]|nr:hypothetical protein [Salmonella enterica subsp. houtenae]ECD9326308.1 hypothetical protein [Salmonella enterica subsp. houtenae]ECJ2525418.1 hypothetical protein [Salmonella enterica subsp. houtenae]EDS2905597.1 hypothetical protein [Salmonella enterica subsp. houtenae]EDX5633220.1 hypothetical protein [Salmonella enterica subsp. houtenae]
MNLKNVLLFIIFLIPLFSEASEYVLEKNYKLQWSNDNGTINNINIAIDGNKINANAVNVSSGKEQWSLKDYVSQCELDLALDIIPESFEVVDLFNDGNKVALFAYNIGCVGGVDPVSVKYFAFHNGVKYALRGHEMFITDKGVDEDYISPKPDDNLKKMLNYLTI